METAQTADYAVRALLELEQRDGQTIAQMAESLGLHRSIAQRVIATLHERGAVTKDLHGKYWLGPLLIALTEKLPHELAIVGNDTIRRLALQTEETVVVAVRDGDDTVIVARENGSTSPLRIEYEIGFRQPLSLGASSLAILAYLDHRTIHRILAGEDRAQIQEVRERGFAQTAGQIRRGMVGVGAPVFAGTLGVVASVTVVVPSTRADRIDAIATEVLRAAGEVSDAYVAHLGEGPPSEEESV